MTLIAIHVDADQAYILTDTWAYNDIGPSQHGSKVHTLPHMDVAVATRGDCEFSLQANLIVDRAANVAVDFDDLVAAVAAGAPKVWSYEVLQREQMCQALGIPPDEMPPSVVYLVGLDRAQDRFRAVMFASTYDFVPVDLDGLHVIPSPLSVRPHDLELRWFADHFAAHLQTVSDTGASPELLAEHRQVCDENMAYFRALPGGDVRVPRDEAEWVRLGVTVREDRMLRQPAALRYLIGGDLHLTVLTRGMVVTARVHTFDDSGEEFTAAMAGTLHPLGQAGPCPCGSGERFIDCCAAVGELCPCWSGKAFKDCCSINAGAVDAAAMSVYPMAVSTQVG